MTYDARHDITVILSVVSARTRYYQESREGIYSGPTFLLSNLISNLPLSAFTTCLSAFIVFRSEFTTIFSPHSRLSCRGLKEELVCETGIDGKEFCQPISNVTNSQLAQLQQDNQKTLHYENQYYPDFVFYWLALWASYLYAEQVTLMNMLVIKSSYTAASVSIYIFIIFLVLGSGTVRSLSSMPELIYHLSFIVQPRYSGALLNGLEFYNKSSLVNLSWRNETTGRVTACMKDDFRYGCRYVNGTHYLVEKYSYSQVELDTMLDIFTNTAINFAFPAAIMMLNMIWYIVPLPAFVKAKFRE